MRAGFSTPVGRNLTSASFGSVNPARDYRLPALWITLALYAAARVSQLYADRLPILLIVYLHVVPPAIFAGVHGSLVLGRRGILTFAALCLGTGTMAEFVGLRTGFPFGRYHFTDVMGPKILDIPILLALAYLGIGYCAWIMAAILLNAVERPLRGAKILAVPFLASLVMTSWDLAMDPDWSILDKAWIWHEGGAYFGVPVSNFFGWFGTNCLYYLAFGLVARARGWAVSNRSPSLLYMAPLLYGVCALGNLLIPVLPMAPPVVTDATGRPWSTVDIMENCVVVSLFVMTTFAATALIRVRKSAQKGVSKAPIVLLGPPIR
jgi:putative membrane protein